MLLRQLFDVQSSTYTYLVADPDRGEAVLIDPVLEQVPRDAALVAELGLSLLWTLETHVHADHVTGAWQLRRRLGSRIALAHASTARGADRLLAHGDRVTFGRHALEVRATPGHTAGCVTYVADDRRQAFTGDALLIRGCGRTDFQGGSAEQLFDSIHRQIFTLPDDCLLWPGHDYRGLTVTSVGEERRFNPRLGGQVQRDDFVGYMRHLGLPHPKLIDVAVPANLRCGEPLEPPPPIEQWAPLTLTFGGIVEVEPHWVEEHLPELRLIDVREPAEFDGPLGHVRGATLIPLGTLAARMQEIGRDKPVVVVCRSGARSAQASLLMRKAGFERVANLAGGMLRWHAQRLPVDAGHA